jgi:hypothetical protein
MSRNQEQIIKSNSVSNKEALRDKIHEIHNYLRNNGAGYGMTALKISRFYNFRENSPDFPRNYQETLKNSSSVITI